MNRSSPDGQNRVCWERHEIHEDKNKVELYYFPDVKSIFLDSQDMKET